MNARDSKLAVIGQGYVGLPLSMAAVAVGFDVVGVDVNVDRIGMLLRGESYVEDIPSSQVASSIASGQFTPTTEIDDCMEFDVAVITVPTPLRDGAPDLSFIEESSTQLAPLVRKGATVILESTTYPGTTEELMIPILEAGSGFKAGVDFFVGYSPERIDPGNARYHFTNTPKVVSGIDAASLAAVDGFYSRIVETTVPVSTTRVAELSKLLENTFRHVNIALVNELARFASALNVDVWEAIDAASSKPFGYMRFVPGPGVGGHCLPVDPSYLSWKVEAESGEPFRFIELANDINEQMPEFVVTRATELLASRGKPISSANVVVIGLAYKKNTSDVRESPALHVCELLEHAGAAVKVVDPHVVESTNVPWMLAPLSPELIDAADLVIIVTDHDNLDYDLITSHAQAIFDTRHRLSPASNVTFL